MTNVTINTDITLSTQQLMSAVAQLNTDELEAFLAGVEALLKQRQQDTPLFSLSSPTPSRDTASDIPIVEALIPRSITLDGSDVSL